MQRKLRKWVGLSALSLLALVLIALPGKETLVPAMSQSVPAAAKNQWRLVVDGVEIKNRGINRAGTKKYALAEEFLDALDESFWGEEKAELSYRPIEQNGREYLCVDEFCAEHHIGIYDEGDQGSCWCTSAAGDWEPPEGVRVPILMYHGVGEIESPLYVPPGELEAQLQWLLEQGYTPIWFEDLHRADEIEKPVILSFDDGSADNYTQLFPLLQKYGVKATIFVVVGYLDTHEEAITSQQLKEMVDSGLVSAQCHTLYHPRLDELEEEEQRVELTWSKVELMKITGRIPCALAYPYGRANEISRSISRGEYRFAVEMSGPVYVTGEDPMRIYRRYVYAGISREAFAALL